MLTPGERAAGSVAAGRSVELRLRFEPGWLWWGATWSVACGAAAAWPWATGTATLARLGAAWFVSVPMLGALRSESGSTSTSATDRAGSVDRRSRIVARLALAVCTVSVAALLGGAEALLAVAAILVSALPARAPGHFVGGGTRDSVLEILVPGALAWLALDGPTAPPAALAVAEGTRWALTRWMVDNGAVPGILAAFALVHRGSSLALRRRSLDTRWRELVAGYGMVLALLVLEGRGVGTFLVALLFAAQWPMQSALRSGRALWHLRRAQWLAMAAMLAAMACL